MLKTFKVELAPNNKQLSLLKQAAGASRWAYNWAIDEIESFYELTGNFINEMDLRKILTKLKHEKYQWLETISNDIPKQAIKDCSRAYVTFFKKGAKRPKFKSKRKSKPSFYQDTSKIKVSLTHVHITKIGAIRLKEKAYIPSGSKYFNPRVTCTNSHWYLSAGVEVPDKELEGSNTCGIGIDLGVKTLAVISTGLIYQGVNKSSAMRKINKTLKRAQRRASRLYERSRVTRYNKSSNLLKLEQYISSLYKRITDLRDNYIHQMTTALVKTKPEYIVVEDLNVSGMLKNKHLSHAIRAQKFYEIRRQLTYKCAWYGIRLIVANRFYPSSKRCSDCGTLKKDLQLKDRVHVCKSCGTIKDRDLNAAINLKLYPLLQSA